MHTRAVLALSLFGVAMGCASTMGWTGRAEPWLWIGIAVVCAAVLVRVAPGRFFLHGFLTGLLAGGVAPLIQSALFLAYLANNPAVAEQLAGAARALPARAFFALMAIPIGLVSGVFLGLLTWVTSRLLRRG